MQGDDACPPPHAVKSANAIASLRHGRSQPIWRLLAADLAPVTLGLFQAHLHERDKPMPASLLFERLERDLENLRALGEDLPQTAKGYVANWLAEGWLERRFPAGANEEEYELSAAAVAALRFATSLGHRRAMATESRLALVMDALRTLADDTDRDKYRRLERLNEERERIEQEIEVVQKGQMRVLPEAQALERAREIIGLTDELMGDFRRVRDEFAHLNRELRANLLDQEGSRGDVLDALFGGIDVIGESDAGRTFQAFWRLLTDPQQSAALDDALESLQHRDFIDQLDSRERRFLARVPQMLLEQGSTVHEVLQHFARSLKAFVQSREFLEQRRIQRLIGDAQRMALDLRDFIRTTEPVYELALTSGRLNSLSRWVLHDPTLAAPATRMSAGEAAPIDISTVGDLVAQSEIDFEGLKAQVRRLLEVTTQVSVGEVIAAFPPSQGLGSVIGLIALASKHGETGMGHQVVAWEGADGTSRRARIGMLYFLRERIDDLA